MSSKLISSSTLVIALAAATVLGACGRNDGRDGDRASDSTSTQRVETPVASTANGASEPGTGAASDMAITASVKTRLAADTRLSALAINVDTSAGQVVLRGTAPDTAARTQATELARGVPGVVGVDNALTVQVPAQ